jgi:hypothetical protein
MSAALLQIALRLLALGLSVIPVPRPRQGVAQGLPGDGKVPALAWREYQMRLPAEGEVREWFGAEPMNLAVITGAISGIVVIDADDREAVRWVGRRLPYTPWQTQTARGFHLWYRSPDVRVPNRARLETPEGRLAIDVRGDGGYVIAPGSIHASGAEYLEAGDWSAPRERVPVFWPGWLQRPQRSATHTPTPRFIGEPLTRARAYLAAECRSVAVTPGQRRTDVSRISVPTCTLRANREDETPTQTGSRLAKRRPIRAKVINGTPSTLGRDTALDGPRKSPTGTGAVLPGAVQE